MKTYEFINKCSELIDETKEWYLNLEIWQSLLLVPIGIFLLIWLIDD